MSDPGSSVPADQDIDAGSQVGSHYSVNRTVSVQQRRARLAALEQKQLYSRRMAEIERQQLVNEQTLHQLRLERELTHLKAELAGYQDAVIEYQTIDSDITFRMPVSSAESPLGVTPILPVVSGSVTMNPLQSISTPVQVSHFMLPLPVTSYMQSPLQTINATPIMTSAIGPHASNLSNVSAPPSLPAVTGITEVGVNNTTSLESIVKQSQLPKLVMNIFKGDPLEFQQWMTAFEKLIEEVTTDPARRLQYLNQYTSGEPNVIVSGYVLGQSQEDYKRAKDELRREYGSPYVVARSYIDKIEKWPNITMKDVDSLNNLAIFLRKCQGSMPSLRHLAQLNTDLYLQRIIAKMPYQIQASWRKVVSRYEENNMDINFECLVSFITEQARIAKHPVFSTEALSSIEGKPRHDVYQTRPGSRPTSRSVTLATTTTDRTHCSLCGPGTHLLDECRRFLGLSLPERKQFLVDKRLCFCCFKPTSPRHTARSCRERLKCTICQRLHPTALHGLQPTPSQKFNSTRPSESATVNPVSTETQVKSVTSCAALDTHDSTIVMSLVKVHLYHSSNPDDFQIVYAALDNLSSASFIDTEVWNKLGSPGVSTSISMKTITGELTTPTTAVENLCVKSVNDNIVIQLPKLYTQSKLPIDHSEIPCHSLLKKWPHLTSLITHIPDRDETIPVGLLIGANCVKALEPHQFIPSSGGGPYAIKTALGWCISGPSGDISTSHVSCHRISIVEDTQIKEMFTTMYNSDFIEGRHAKTTPEITSSDDTKGTALLTNEKLSLSQEDKNFMQLMHSETKLMDGHYQCPLPFRNKNPVMPNNRTQAVQRAAGIKRRLDRDQKFKHDYQIFMKQIIDKGYAQEVPKVTDGSNNRIVWYLPHHGVYHSQKPDKIRVVFDCSAKFLDASLNNELVQGPNFTNLLVGVLIRFRQEPVAIIADIESMFYQVKVPNDQLDYLRFVWWPDGNTEAELADYQMKVHLFGAVSSPSCANYALRKTADDNESKYGTEASNTLRRNFYVDDLLKSVESTQVAIDLITSVRATCKAGGFNLTKFASNDRRVLESISVVDRANNIIGLSLSRDALPTERALGVHWCIENDTIKFRITLQDKPPTKRGVLSTISSIYDPLGLASPFLLKGRRILQHLCATTSGWDDSIPNEPRTEWEKWKLSLLSLESLQLDRCFKSNLSNDIKSVSLHHFSDASQEGYGQCSYIRIVDTSGQIKCSLVMAKSRVPPMKPITIPRLELVAATVSAKIGILIRSELDYNIISETYWTDSKVVLSYIQNEVRRFRVFVANRVQLIRENTNSESWKYIDTSQNPADDASRGLCGTKVEADHRWFKGPDFLYSCDESWTSNQNSVPIADGDHEVITTKKVCSTKTQQYEDLISRLELRYSSWTRLRRAVSIWLLFREYIRNKKTFRLRDINIELLQKADIEIFKSVQKRAFQSELDQIKTTQSVIIDDERTLRRKIKRSSLIYRLDPFCDQQNLLRVGGRLRRADIEYEVKHPIILPKLSPVSRLIVTWCHERVHHSGRGLTLNELRCQGYWVLQGNSLVRSIIHKCVKCRALRGVTGEQKMSDLPEDRVISCPPFTFCAVDYFGPFLIKQGRNELKRYGCLFTCLSSRAVHIETTTSLDTSSFINALRRFIARRGEIRELRSDRGTNFIGAESELQKAIHEMNHDEISRFLQQNGADYKYIIWKRNPPYASHMGGVWERQIRSTRAILSSLLRDRGSVLDDESFRTLLTEVEAIINSRPLTVDTLSDALSPIPLSPINLLTMKSKVILPPPGCFQQTDLYCRRRWRRVQHLANEFWIRWKREYLSSLQTRSTNCVKRRNFRVGDIVLVKNIESCRNDWPMAKVTDVHYDDINDCVRSVTILLARHNLNDQRVIKERSIDNLVLLLAAEYND